MPARGTKKAPDQPANGGSSSAVVVFDPKRATAELVQAVEGRRDQLAALLGAELESERGKALVDRFVTVALHAATSNPDILRASKESIVESIRDSAMLGLEPVGAAGDGAIVVYNEKVKEEVPGRHGGTIVVERSVPTAHFQPMYRGLLKLARRSDRIAFIDAHVVYEGDEIKLDLGSQPSVVHYPVLDGAKRGGYVGAYAVAELTNGRRYVDWMTLADIETVRKSSRAKDSGPWVTFWTEMARKTVLRRLLKRLPLETMAEHALRIENEAEERAIAPMAEIPAETDSRRRLRSRFVADQPTDEANPGASEPGAGQEDAPAEETKKEASEPEAGATAVQEAESAPAEAEDAEATEICGATSDPSLGDPETCVLEPGHSNPDKSKTPHQSKEGTRWPNR